MFSLIINAQPFCDMNDYFHELSVRDSIFCLFKREVLCIFQLHNTIL